MIQLWKHVSVFICCLFIPVYQKIDVRIIVVFTVWGEHQMIRTMMQSVNRSGYEWESTSLWIQWMNEYTSTDQRIENWCCWSMCATALYIVGHIFIYWSSLLLEWAQANCIIIAWIADYDRDYVHLYGCMVDSLTAAIKLFRIDLRWWKKQKDM